MKVSTVYAHENPRSFCHSALERFTADRAEIHPRNGSGDEHRLVDNIDTSEQRVQHLIDGRRRRHFRPLSN
jgi:hypothetical protein